MMKYTSFNKVKLLSVRFLGDFGMYEFPGGERGCSIPPKLPNHGNVFSLNIISNRASVL